MRHELRATNGSSEVAGWDAALDAAYARMRMRFEPVVEVTQIKVGRHAGEVKNSPQ